MENNCQLSCLKDKSIKVVLQKRNQGKGAAIREGIKHALPSGFENPDCKSHEGHPLQR